MTSSSYLAYFPDPFGIGGSRYVVLTERGTTLVPANELAIQFPSIVTYDASALIDDLRRLQSPLPRQIIDVAEALRLAIGLSKSDGGERKWDFWRAIKRYYQTEAGWGRSRALHNSRSQRLTDDDEYKLLSETAQALREFWASLKRELHEKGESARFFEVELPCAQIFYSRQYEGLPIDETNVVACLQAATYAKYTAYRAVANDLGVSPTGLNYWNVSRHLASTDVSRLSDVAEGYALRDQLKMSRDISHFARIFTELMDAGRDVDVLTRLSDSAGAFTLHFIRLER